MSARTIHPDLRRDLATVARNLADDAESGRPLDSLATVYRDLAWTWDRARGIRTGCTETHCRCDPFASPESRCPGAADQIRPAVPGMVPRKSSGGCRHGSTGVDGSCTDCELDGIDDIGRFAPAGHEPAERIVL